MTFRADGRSQHVVIARPSLGMSFISRQLLAKDVMTTAQVLFNKKTKHILFDDFPETRIVDFDK